MASIINLSFLLLLLSGDVELNPGPATPKYILRKYSDKLSKSISANINNVTNALHAKDLITSQTRGYIVTVVGVTNGDKANTVMLDIEGQLDASLDDKQYLTKVCNVLSNQGGAIKEIANAMLQELDGAAGGTTADTAPTPKSKELTLGNLMRACAPSTRHYSIIGIGLDVNISDLQPLPTMTTANLTIVFQRWIDSNKDVTWGKLLQVCDDFSDQLGKMKADIQKFLGVYVESAVADKKMIKLLKEGDVTLHVTRVNMHGPPGAGKTCSQHLLLNEDPPSEPVTDSTPITKPAVRATRGPDYKWERVTKAELTERVAAELQENSQHISESDDPAHANHVPSPNASSAAENVPSLAVANDGKDKQQANSRAIAKIQEILRAGPKNIRLSDQHWAYIIDSGGQPAYQELLALFVRAASLNIITLDLSKPFDEKLEATYRIGEKNWSCGSMATQLTCFKSIVSSGEIFKPLSTVIPDVIVKEPSHSMHLVLGTHYDKVDEELKEKVLNDREQKLKPYTRNHVIQIKAESYILPVNTIATGESRDGYNEQICNVLKRNDVSLKITIPFRWFAFELALPEEKKIVTITEIMAIGKECGMEEDDTKRALEYLHGVTLMLYYPGVIDVVFLDPQPILQILSDLLALTYIDSDRALDAISVGVQQQEIDYLKQGFFNKSLLEKLKKCKSISDKFESQPMIKLLCYLNIISEAKNTEKGKKYFIPYALPSYTTFTKPKSEAKPLLIVWKEGPHNVLPVPQGIFPLTISHLLNQEKPKIVIPITAEHFYKYRNAMSLRVTIEEQDHTLHLVNQYTHIEVYFIGPEEYRPDIRLLLTEAIKKSADAMHMKHNYVNAFACPKDNNCYCIITNDSLRKTNCIRCEKQANIKDESYWSWFITSSSASSGAVGGGGAASGKTVISTQGSVPPWSLMDSSLKTTPGAVGLALIVSNDHKGTDRELKTTETDGVFMEKAFEWLGYATIRMHNWNLTQLEELLRTANETPYPESCRRIAFVFAGHGRMIEKEHLQLVMNDGKPIDFDSVQKYLSPSPEKPHGTIGSDMVRLFFLDTCRGKQHDAGMQVPSRTRGDIDFTRIPKEVYENCLICFSTRDGFAASDDGDFLPCVAEKLTTCDEYITAALNEAKAEMQDKFQNPEHPIQSPETIDRLTTKVYLLREKPCTATDHASSLEGPHSMKLQSAGGGSGAVGGGEAARGKTGKELNLDNVTQVFTPSASHYSIIGIGLGVDVADLIPLPNLTIINFTTVFQRWIDSGKDVTWGKLLQVCDNYPGQLGRAKANLEKFLSS